MAFMGQSIAVCEPENFANIWWLLNTMANSPPFRRKIPLCRQQRIAQRKIKKRLQRTKHFLVDHAQ
jgi:hypothetical protein